MAVIEVRDLRKRYADLMVLDGVSFSVEEGEIFGILGPNGAGKTTAVECVEGLRRPDGGSIRVLGLDPIENRGTLCEQTGVQLQDTQLPDNLKVWEALDLYASFYAKPCDWRELLQQWGLEGKRDARFGKLSGGQRQRLFIALALVGDPRVVFLDELTTGLDPQARRATWALIKQIRATGVTVVLVSHYMDEVEELCDRAAIFDQGRIVTLDTPSGIVAEIDAEYEMRFTLIAGDLADVAGLPGVVRATRNGDYVVVTGRGDFATAVTAQLARDHVLVSDLRIDRRSLDDAFIALTGQPFD